MADDTGMTKLELEEIDEDDRETRFKVDRLGVGLWARAVFAVLLLLCAVLFLQTIESIGSTVA